MKKVISYSPTRVTATAIAAVISIVLSHYHCGSDSR